MKKIACVLVLACVIMTGAFAQQKPAAAPSAPAASGGGGGSSAKVFKNSVGMDIVPLFAGLINWDENDYSTYTEFRVSFSYERLLVPHFSIGPNLDTWFGKIDYDARGVDDDELFYICINGEARYYPMANFDKLFFGAALGFNVLSVNGKSKPKDGGFAGLFFAVKTGYKVITSKGFYMEPSLAYNLSEHNAGWDPRGWQVGLRLGFSF